LVSQLIAPGSQSGTAIPIVFAATAPRHFSWTLRAKKLAPNSSSHRL
jgi:hypothetical protein